METRPVLFEIEKLRFSYRPGTPVLHEISLTLDARPTAIIGQNGAGKTTLVKLLKGLLRPEGGVIRFRGEDIAGRTVASLAAQVGYVFQNPDDQIFRYNVLDEVMFGPLNIGMDEKTAREKSREALAMTGLAGLEDRNPYDLELYERKMVAIASVLAMDPDVLILDEPTSFLDVKHKLELLAILEKMAREKKMTVIMSLHEIDLAQKVSDKIVCVQGENISHFGKPEEVFQEEIIRDLYGITNGSFDPRFGSIELPGIKGEPEVLVISSGGSGIPVYRKLRKERIPFAAGILYENDIDCELARQLAVEVITEKAFEEISDETFASAEKMIERCGRVIDAGVQIGTYNRRIGELLEQAERLGKLERAGTLK